MTLDELYDLTPRSFTNKMIGYTKREELLMQNHWEQTRMIVHSCLSPHLKRKMKPSEIMPFDWDKIKKQKKTASQEEIQEVLKKYRARAEKNKI
tara:strand:- start:377 stop:658 length:282 start_codon:yes stop_codon:yes gene_type:complete